MSRKEFPAAVKRAALARAAGYCEGCPHPPSKLHKGKYHFDHVIPDGLTGVPTLDNCKVLCTVCHAEKTRNDVGMIAKAKRVEAVQNGTKAETSRGFPKRAEPAAKPPKQSKHVSHLDHLPRRMPVTIEDKR